MTLGLSNYESSSIRLSMMTSGDQLPGYEITELLGTVEEIAEKGFPILGIGNFIFEKGGGISE